MLPTTLQVPDLFFSEPSYAGASESLQYIFAEGQVVRPLVLLIEVLVLTGRQATQGQLWPGGKIAKGAVGGRAVVVVPGSVPLSLINRRLYTVLLLFQPVHSVSIMLFTPHIFCCYKLEYASPHYV